MFLIWTTDFDNSVLKMILCGPRIRINQSYPGNIRNRSLHFSQNPGNLENLSFSSCSYPGNIGNCSFPIFYYPGSIGNLSCCISWYPGNIENLFCGRAGVGRGAGAEPPAGRRWRRRRRLNNSAIWPDPWTITPRDQISRSGSIPHFDIIILSESLPAFLESSCPLRR